MQPAASNRLQVCEVENNFIEDMKLCATNFWLRHVRIPLHSSGADHRICDLSMIVLLFCLLVQSRADSVAPTIPTVLVGDRLAVSSPMLHLQTRSWPAAEEVQDTLEKSVLLNVNTPSVPVDCILTGASWF
jgi:hypothetical protein